MSGTGHITVTHQLAPGMVQQMRMACDQCGGIGKVVNDPCNHCHGQGISRGPRHYEIYVKPGQPRDSPHVLEGEGDKNPNWIPGDLIVLLKEELDKSWGYRRIGSHLYRTEALTLNESLYGGWKEKLHFWIMKNHNSHCQEIKVFLYLMEKLKLFLVRVCQ